MSNFDIIFICVSIDLAAWLLAWGLIEFGKALNIVLAKSKRNPQMSKYCTLRDHPITAVSNLFGQEEIWGGCMLYGVWHKCESCPNVIEVGDGSYGNSINQDASRAEMEARKAYPYEGGTKGYVCESSIPIFVRGYHKAERDIANELRTIISISMGTGWLENNIKTFVEELEKGL